MRPGLFAKTPTRVSTSNLVGGPVMEVWGLGGGLGISFEGISETIDNFFILDLGLLDGELGV